MTVKLAASHPSSAPPDRAPTAAPDHVGDQLVLAIEAGDLPTPMFAFRPAPRPGAVAAAVAAFHRAFGLPLLATPDVSRTPDRLLALRTALLDEEATEFSCSAARRDMVGMADALADVVYVCYGTALTLGVDLDAVIGEVHRANMSKLDEDGRPVMRHDGKVLKSPRYTPPDVARILGNQLPLPF